MVYHHSKKMLHIKKCCIKWNKEWFIKLSTGTVYHCSSKMHHIKTTVLNKIKNNFASYNQKGTSLNVAFGYIIVISLNIIF